MAAPKGSGDGGLVTICPSSASYAQTASHFGCNTAPSSIECIRGIPAQDIETYISQANIDFPPTVDGMTFVSDVRSSIISKEFANIPFLIGTTKDEGHVFITAFGLGPANTSASAAELISFILPSSLVLQTAVLAAYAPLGLSAYELVSAVFTDLAFTCTTSTLSILAALNGYKVWGYQYADIFPNLATFPDPGAYHTVEIPSVWGTYPIPGSTLTQQQLSKYMQGVWVGLAKRPGRGVPWPRLGTNLPAVLGLLGGRKAPDGEQTVVVGSVDAVCAVYGPIIAAGNL